MSALATRRLRLLTLSPPAPAFLGAASGLVRVKAHLYVIADDELSLGVFSATGRKPGYFHKLFAGTLPARKKPRKKRKPDLEALALLPPMPEHRHGALLILGSGSRPRRRRGAIQSLDADGAPAGRPERLDLSPLYRRLEKALGELNIEGAAVQGEALLLFQRGNRGPNAVARLKLRQALALLRGGRGAIAFTVRHYDLGAIDGVPLGFTDAAPLDDGSLLFTAVAEAADNAYDDGPCRGAAIGLLDGKGRLAWLRPLKARIKAEGIHAARMRKRLEILLVTDADDASVPAGLYRVL